MAVVRLMNKWLTSCFSLLCALWCALGYVVVLCGPLLSLLDSKALFLLLDPRICDIRAVKEEAAERKFLNLEKAGKSTRVDEKEEEEEKALRVLTLQVERNVNQREAL